MLCRFGTRRRRGLPLPCERGARAGRSWKGNARASGNVSRYSPGVNSRVASEAPNGSGRGLVQGLRESERLVEAVEYLADDVDASPISNERFQTSLGVDA